MASPGTAESDVKACYDNPLFEEDAKAPYQGGNSPRAHAANHADAPRGGKDYLHARTPPPHEVQFKSPKSRRRRQILIFAFLFFIIAIIALIIGLLVHFLGAKNTSQPIQATSLPVISRSDAIRGSLHIRDGPYSVFTPDLANMASQAFHFFAQTFVYKMDTIFRHSDLSSTYNGTDILQLSSGSVVVTFRIRLNFALDLTEPRLDDVRQLLLEGFRTSVFSIEPSSLYLYVDVPMTTPVVPVPPGQCEPVMVYACANKTRYPLTAFPNVLGHVNHEQANAGAQQLKELFTTTVYIYQKDFLCSLLAPECKAGKPLPPCRSFCEVVRDKFLAVNVSWPINCTSLPDSSDPDVCLPDPYIPGKCVEIENPSCRALGFTNSSFPGLAGMLGEMEVMPILLAINTAENSTHCYKHAALAACALYLSPCSGNSTAPYNVIPPCRSLCQALRDRCEIFLEIFYLPWPSELSCDRFPDSPDPSVCIGYNEAHEPPEPHECQVGELRCDKDRCIPHSWLCDGYQDCEDDADEKHCASCESWEYKCVPVSMLCINKTSVCDGTKNCYEGVDEKMCTRVAGAEQRHLLEVYDPEDDSWQEVCADGWDAQHSHIVCQQLGYKAVVSAVTDTGSHNPKARLTGLRDGTDPAMIQSYLTRSETSCPDHKVVRIHCGDAVCGVRPAYVPNALRIVGGDAVRPGTWPWLASLHGGSAGKFFCGASVLAEQWVLTAGHCIGGGVPHPEWWEVRAGHTRRDAYTPFRQIRRGKRLFLHPGYNQNTADNDVALIQLDKPLVFSDYLRPVCLPRNNQFVAVGTRCLAAGWGKSHDRAWDYERVAREVQLDVAPWDLCKRALNQPQYLVPYILSQNMICAGGTAGYDSCAGDSGSAFVCRKPNTTDEWYQAGVVSWGVGCAMPQVYGVYTKMPNHVDWIQEVMANYTSSAAFPANATNL